MAFDEGDWGAFLSRELGLGVRVRYGRARHRVLEARPARASSRRGSFGMAPGTDLEVRMSAFFGEAPAEVREAVARWLRSGRRARRSAKLLDRFIADSLESLPTRPKRAPRLHSRGSHHDLTELVDEVARADWEELAFETWPGITWGRRTRSRAYRSLQLGSYVSEQHLVRIHPVLDSDRVPAWFVRYVLYHELLHAALPPVTTKAGRTLHHGPDFRLLERRYPDYRRALAWQEKNLPELLRRARDLPPVTTLEPVRATASRGSTEPPPPQRMGQGFLFRL